MLVGWLDLRRRIQDDDAFGYGSAVDLGDDVELEEAGDFGGFGGGEFDGGVRRDGSEEFHLADGGEMKGLAGLAGGDAGGLGSGFGEDDAGDKGVAGEMAAEEGLGGGEMPGADGELAGVKIEDGIDEDEGLPVGEAAANGVQGLPGVHGLINR